jgi:hypothetical protein
MSYKRVFLTLAIFQAIYIKSTHFPFFGQEVTESEIIFLPMGTRHTNEYNLLVPVILNYNDIQVDRERERACIHAKVWNIPKFYIYLIIIPKT